MTTRRPETADNPQAGNSAGGPENQAGDPEELPPPTFELTSSQEPPGGLETTTIDDPGGTPLSITAVPEPATLFLLTPAVMLVVRRARARRERDAGR